jgi:uncharacterized protein (TIGR02246 family)
VGLTSIALVDGSIIRVAVSFAGDTPAFGTCALGNKTPNRIFSLGNRGRVRPTAPNSKRRGRARVSWVCGTAIGLGVLSVEGFRMGSSLSGVPDHDVPAGIEKLHRADVAATLARDIDGLTELWDDDAVLLQPGQAPIVGRAAFHEFVKQNFAKSPSAKVLKYTPHIRDLKVVDGVAYEWGYFDSTFQPPKGAPSVTFQARFMRVLRQQADGSWKFARVIWAAE